MKSFFCILIYTIFLYQNANAYETPISILDLNSHSEIDYYVKVFNEHNYFISGDTLEPWKRYEKKFGIVSSEHVDTILSDYEVRLEFTPKSRVVHDIIIKAVSTQDTFVKSISLFYENLKSTYGQPDSACYLSVHWESKDVRDFFPVSNIGEDSISIKSFFEQGKPFIIFWTKERYHIELSTDKAYNSHRIPDFRCYISDVQLNKKNQMELAAIEEEKIAEEQKNQIIRSILIIALCLLFGIAVIYFLKEYQKKEEENKRKLKIEEERHEKKQKEINENEKKYKIELEDKYGKITRIVPYSHFDNDLLEYHDDIIVFGEAKKIILYKKEYDFIDILSCSMYDQNHKDIPSKQVTRTKTGSMLGRAALGGLTLGVAGALVGAVTAKTETDSNLDNTYLCSYVVKIGLKSIEEPIIKFEYGCDKSKAEEVYAMIQAIIAMK